MKDIQFKPRHCIYIGDTLVRHRTGECFRVKNITNFAPLHGEHVKLFHFYGFNCLDKVMGGLFENEKGYFKIIKND